MAYRDTGRAGGAESGRCVAQLYSACDGLRRLAGLELAVAIGSACLALALSGQMAGAWAQGRTDDAWLCAACCALASLATGVFLEARRTTLRQARAAERAWGRLLDALRDAPGDIAHEEGCRHAQE